MKNPFIQMALVAAAMVAAFQENRARDLGVSMPSGPRRFRSSGQQNPPGTKILRQFYRNKHGVKGTAKEAREWYASLK